MITVSFPTGSVVVTSIAQDTDHSAAWNLRGKHSDLAILLPGLLPKCKTATESTVLVQVVVVAHRPMFS